MSNRRRTGNKAMRPLRRLMVSIVVVFVGLGLATTPDDRPDRPPTGSGTGYGYTHQELQPDTNMTQQMSTSNADTGSQSHQRDAQLARSQNLNYVRALEQHQVDIDLMLAR